MEFAFLQMRIAGELAMPVNARSVVFFNCEYNPAAQ